jgi:hypothetical protein
VDLRVAAPNPPGGGVETKVGDLENCGAFDGRATRERPQPREQLGERERLRQVIVRTGVETRD